MKSHTHESVNITSSSITHGHTGDSARVRCRTFTYLHRHALIISVGGGHTHPITVNFAAAELGSPNWWEHKHLMSGSVDNADGVHTHGFGTWTYENYCAASGCSDSPHAHKQDALSTASGGSIHSHTFPTSAYTDNANPAGTPENHVHPFSFNVYTGDDHTHTVNGNLTTQYCALGYDHIHATGTTTSSTNHIHTGSGNSGSGGEPPPAVAQPLGDGITFTV